MKKILVVHTKYQKLGGEDVAVDNEIELLKEYYEVKELFYSNKIKNYLFDVISLISSNNKKSVNKLLKTIDEFKPDYAYVHNTWFMASTGIFKALEDSGTEIILKLHNFRYSCTRSFLANKHFKDSPTCNACGLNRKSMGFINKYYENSFFKSLLVANYGKKYFDIIQQQKLKILVLTNFHKEYLSKIITNRNIYVFPNFIELQKNVIKENREKYIVYAGRVSQEKGVEELIKTFKKIKYKDLKFKIIGDGPLLEFLKNNYKEESIQFLGYIPNKEVLKIIKSSEAVVSATKLYEGQPTLLCEASSMGVPSIFPDSGGISEFFPKNYKLSFRQFDYEHLLEKLESIKDTDLVKEIGKENREYIKEYLGKEKLIEIFSYIVDE